MSAPTGLSCPSLYTKVWKKPQPNPNPNQPANGFCPSRTFQSQWWSEPEPWLSSIILGRYLKKLRQSPNQNLMLSLQSLNKFLSCLPAPATTGPRVQGHTNISLNICKHHDFTLTACASAQKFNRESWFKSYVWFLKFLKDCYGRLVMNLLWRKVKLSSMLGIHYMDKVNIW